jgi:hypothetical protein
MPDQPCRGCGQAAVRTRFIKTGWRWHEWFPGGRYSDVGMAYLEMPVCRLCDDSLGCCLKAHLDFLRKMPSPY